MLRSRFNNATASAVIARSLRQFSAEAEDQQGRIGPKTRSWLVAATTLVLGGSLAFAEESEIQSALYEFDGRHNGSANKSESRLVELISPYVCSMSHIDIMCGHEGSGKSTAVQAACSQAGQGAVYLDLKSEGEVGTAFLEQVSGGHRGRLSQRVRDFIAGGTDRHGVTILEKAVQRFVEKHAKYPVVVLDHVAPQACRVGEPACTVLQLGRAEQPETPSMRLVLIMNDSQVETLYQSRPPNSEFRLFKFEGMTAQEARSFLTCPKNGLPQDLAAAIVDLVGGHIAHLDAAAKLWTGSTRWLSPMTPLANEGTIQKAVDTHYQEFRRLIYWEIDKRLRVEAQIGLWPSATGNAPVNHQNPTDEDATTIVDLLDSIARAPLSARAVKNAIGKERFAQLLQAQVLGYIPKNEPIETLPHQLIDFGLPAIKQYYFDRLKNGPSASIQTSQSNTQNGYWWTRNPVSWLK